MPLGSSFSETEDNMAKAMEEAQEIGADHFLYGTVAIECKNKDNFWWQREPGRVLALTISYY